MAIGAIPKHIEDLSLNDFTHQQFLVLANEVVTKIGWTLDYINDNGLIANTNNGVFSWNAEIKIKIEDGYAYIQSASTGGDIIDLGKNKKNVANFMTNFEELKLNLTNDELDSKYLDLKEHFASQEEDILLLQEESIIETIKNQFSLFIPIQGFFITPILINLNLLIFILMAFSGADIIEPDPEILLNWGANLRPMTLEGEWWRLISNCFVHIGFMHLLLNIYALLNIGILLEPYIGRTRFISAYLLAGITASIASLWWYDNTISAGASGAVFGMYGIFLAMLTTNLIDKKTRKNLLISIVVFVVFNLLEGFKDGIDSAAHFGGLIGGLVIGYASIFSLKKPNDNKLKFGTIGLLTTLILVSSFVIYKKIPNDIGTYDVKIKEFVSMEAMALEVYNLPANTPTNKILNEIKDKGIYYWNENIKLIDSFKDLNLPLEIRTKNNLLKEYCELRIKSYELLYKAISEDTEIYQTQIDDYNKQIEAKIKELGGG